MPSRVGQHSQLSGRNGVVSGNETEVVVMDPNIWVLLEQFKEDKPIGPVFFGGRVFPQIAESYRGSNF